MEANQADEKGIYQQRERVALLKQKLAGISGPDANNLVGVADMLVKKSVWAVGGDGWAYDIGYGGLDHVLASGRNVNILVARHRGVLEHRRPVLEGDPDRAVAKFAAAGKPTPRRTWA